MSSWRGCGGVPQGSTKRGGESPPRLRPWARLRGAYLSPILNILVPQVVHSPRVAGRPFFIWICSVFFISRFCLHFMQYASKPTLLDVYRIGRARAGRSAMAPRQVAPL